MSPTPRISVDPDDCPECVDIIQQIIIGCTNTVRPDEFYVIKIDNWFGDNWVGFSHKFMGVAGVKNLDDLVVPPFKPSRVVSEQYFVKSTSQYEQKPLPSPIHVNLDDMARNEKRKMRLLYPDTAFFWWSGESLRNTRASLMAYLPTLSEHVGWYVAFKRDIEWKTTILKGIDQSELLDYKRRSTFFTSRSH